MPEANRHVCVARLNGKDWYFLWESGGTDPDRVVLDDAGFVMAFRSEQAAREAGTVSPDRTAVYDLDAIESWCKSVAEVRDCSELLNAWNLLGDVPRGENLFGEADARATSIYDKLFWGCNLPAMTPPGEHCVPSWSAAETAALKRLLLLGLAEFRERLR
jgi:hypothetical protein